MQRQFGVRCKLETGRAERTSFLVGLQKDAKPTGHSLHLPPVFPGTESISEEKQLDTHDCIEGDAFCQQDSQPQNSHEQHIHFLHFDICFKKKGEESLVLILSLAPHPPPKKEGKPTHHRWIREAGTKEKWQRNVTRAGKKDVCPVYNLLPIAVSSCGNLLAI